MRHFFILTFLFLATISFSQCTLLKFDYSSIDTLVIGQTDYCAGGDYESNKPNYAPSDRLLRERLYKTYSTDSVVPDKFRQIVKNYIVNRSGQLFYNSLTLDRVKVTSIDSIKKVNPKSWLLKDGKAKYHFEYSFYPEKNISYVFGISLDSDGKIISQDAIPKNKDNLDLTKTIKLCDLIAKIKKQYPTESSLRFADIELLYDKKKNKFYYMVTFSNLYDKEKNFGWGCENPYDNYTFTTDIYSFDNISMSHKIHKVCVD